MRLSARVAGDARGVCTLRVTDQGPGLDAEAVQRLGRHHDGLVPTGAQGVGFGLLFVQRVAQRHGGQLQVEPGPDGRGAQFELVLGAASGNP